MIKCPECKSSNINYYPDMSGNIPRLIYEQSKDGNFKAVLKGSKVGNTDDQDDMTTISQRDLYYNDSRPYFCCNKCTMEFES